MNRSWRSVQLCALALVLGAAAGASTPAVAQTTAQLKARCSQLIAYYDRYAVGRSNDSDGRRNHTRIEAEIDCSRGLYAEGISTMENLLRDKKFTPPAPGLPDEPEDGL